MILLAHNSVALWEMHTTDCATEHDLRLTGLHRILARGRFDSFSPVIRAILAPQPYAQQHNQNNNSVFQTESFKNEVSNRALEENF